MKKLINTLKWLIYHKTDVYVMDEIHYSDLHYSLFFLHRIDKLFGFTIHRCVDKATSLYPSNKQMDLMNRTLVNSNQNINNNINGNKDFYKTLGNTSWGGWVRP